MKRRIFLGSMMSLPAVARAATSPFDDTLWDYIIIGGGTAGMPAAIFAAERGARVLLVDAAKVIGGQLDRAFGQISAAGTHTQAAKGIKDHPDIHYDDVMEITQNKADPTMVRLCVDNAPRMVNWLLDGGLTPLPEHPVTGQGIGQQRYSVPRYLWGADAGRDILAVLNRKMAPALKSGRIATQLETEVTALLTSDAGAVEGIRARAATGEHTFRGRHVLITTGGYASNPEIFTRLIHGPTYTTGTYPTNLGKGLEMATAVGGYLRGHALHQPGSGSVLTDNKYPAKVYARFQTAPQLRQPFEVWVNNDGRRFVKEDEPLPNLRARALAGQECYRYAIVFDQRILDSAPPGLPDWGRGKLMEHFQSHPMFHRGDTLEELAAKSGINAAGLRETLVAYNAAVDSGRDAFGRQHMPMKIEAPPFYAVIHHGHSATSSVGIVVDEHLRVVRLDGEPVPNLYAAGEVLGAGVTLGDTFVPGMMLTPALTFGRLLGERLPIG
jgi:fumarate reductase flavoprotein subunit